jgi:hypothetical protein
MVTILGDIDIQKLNTACQDVYPPKGFDMKNRSKPRIRSVDYHLECCMEVRFSKITISGSNMASLPPWLPKKILSGLHRCWRRQRHTTLRRCLADEIRSVADEPINAKVQHFFDLPRFVYCPHDHRDAQVVRLFPSYTGSRTLSEIIMKRGVDDENSGVARCPDGSA